MRYCVEGSEMSTRVELKSRWRLSYLDPVDDGGVTGEEVDAVRVKAENQPRLFRFETERRERRMGRRRTQKGRPPASGPSRARWKGS